MFLFPARRCAADLRETQKVAELRPGVCRRSAVICPARWSKAAGRCGGTCSGGGTGADRSAAHRDDVTIQWLGLSANNSTLFDVSAVESD